LHGIRFSVLGVDDFFSEYFIGKKLTKKGYFIITPGLPAAASGIFFKKNKNKKRNLPVLYYFGFLSLI